MQNPTDPTQIFIRNWEIYQKIIRQNYMKHNELAAHSQVYFNQLSLKQPIKLLDIGCGDAHQISKQLKDLNLSSYTGYDLSAQAIEFAKQNVENLNAACNFQVGYMEDLIKKDQQTYTALYSSFAIHHLSDEMKNDFIHNCYKRLDDGGLFILIDIKRLPGQSIEAYKKSYADWIHQDWHSLTTDEKHAIIDHLNTCDIPVEASTYIQYANNAGFNYIEKVDIDTRHTLLVFSKN
jgi:cyclopropane fatty-acyl-phospholipid synthase-like methyltransferase